MFLVDDGRETVYGGAARGGKSDALLMAALMFVDVPGYAALILRRTFPELLGADGLLVRAQSWLSNTDARSNESGKVWTFPSGATLRFGHAETEADRFKYDGQAYQFVGFDELTSFTEVQYDHVGFTRMSRSAEVPVPLRTRGSCTPTGSGYGWVRRRFITHREPDVLFVPAKVRDNPGVVAAEYEKGLERVPELLRRRLLEGDWDAFEGAAFSNFTRTLNVVPSFQVPAHWERFESHDHGLGNPTCVLAWAADPDGNLVVHDSYYSERDTMISQHAQALLAKRQAWWPRNERGYLLHSLVSYADHDLWAKSGAERWGQPATLITEYEEHGVEGFVQANKDRKAGRARILELLQPKPAHPFPVWHPRYGQTGAPHLFVVETCEQLVEQLQVAPTNEKPEGPHAPGEVVEGDWESRHGHAIAALRYGAMSWQQPTVEPEPLPDDPREAAIQLMHRHDLQPEDELDLFDEQEIWP